MQTLPVNLFIVFVRRIENEIPNISLCFLFFFTSGSKLSHKFAIARVKYILAISSNDIVAVEIVNFIRHPAVKLTESYLTSSSFNLKVN